MALAGPLAAACARGLTTGLEPVLRAPPLLVGDAPGRLPVEAGGVLALSPRFNKPVNLPLMAAKGPAPSSAAGFAPPGRAGAEDMPGRADEPDDAPGLGASLSPRFSSPLACAAKPPNRAPMPPPSPADLSSRLGAGFLSPESSLPRLNKPPAFEVRPPSFAPKPPPSSFLSRDVADEDDDDGPPLDRSDELTGPDWKPPPGRLLLDDDEPPPLVEPPDDYHQTSPAEPRRQNPPLEMGSRCRSDGYCWKMSRGTTAPPFPPLEYGEPLPLGTFTAGDEPL